MSNINTSRINELFPIAGQNNDSQGFRDNFSNIKVALGNAKLEINSLQNRAVVLGPIGNEVVTNDFNYTLATRPQLKSPSYTFKDLGLRQGTVGVVYTDGSVQKITVVNNIELDFTGFPPTGQYGSVVIWFSVANSSHRVQLPIKMAYGIKGNQQVVNNQLMFPDTGDFLVEFASADNGNTYWLIDFANLGGSGGSGKGATGATGAGPRGATGAQGPAGQFGGITLQYKYRTIYGDTYPGDGKVSLNSPDLGAVNTMFVSKIDINNVAVAGFLRTIDDSTNPIKGHFRISDSLDPSTSAIFTIESISERELYFAVTCGKVSGIQSFSNLENVIITFARTGDVGATGPTGARGATGIDGRFAGIGATGASGFRGYIGETGPLGSTGATGIQGIPGPEGPVGATGMSSVGPTGAPGPTGAAGPGGGRIVLVGQHTGSISPGATFGYGSDGVGPGITILEYCTLSAITLDALTPYTDDTVIQVTKNGEPTGAEVSIALAATPRAVVIGLSVVFASGDVLGFKVKQGEGGGATTMAAWIYNGGIIGATGPRGESGIVAFAGATGATGSKGSTGPIGATGLSGATGADGMGGWYNFNVGAKSPGPRTFPSPNILGFQAHSSTDFPGPYYMGISVHDNLHDTAAQLAMNWNAEEGEPDKIFFRVNDNTGDVANWSSWKRILVDNSLITPSSGNTSVNGIKFPNNPGGGSGDTAYIRYHAYDGEKTVLELGVSNEGFGAAEDSINFVTPEAGGVGVNVQRPRPGLDVNGTVYANAFKFSANNQPYINTSLVSNNSDELAEGVTNKYYTPTRQATILSHISDVVAAEAADRLTGNAVILARLAAETQSRVAGDSFERNERIAGNVAMKQYVDASTYLNLPPSAGVGEENFVPLYSDFKFSLGAQGSYAFYLTDSQGFQVVYFHADTPTGLVRPFRAYRFTAVDEFVYDTEPIAVTFTTSNEYIQRIYNIGTNFAYLGLKDSVTSVTRNVIALTNGNNKSNTWTFYKDVTSITGGVNNIFLLQDLDGDRILCTTMSSTSILLSVYDNTLNLLRSQQLFDNAEVTNIDQTSSGKTVADNTLPFGYNPWGSAFAFTWNKFTEKFIMKAVGYYVYQQNGGGIGQGFGTTILWRIPKTWLISGSDSPNNLIPLKASGYRYHKLPDTTWETPTGGMGEGFGTAGQGPSVLTDEYARTVNLSIVGTWDTRGFQIYSFPYTFSQTIGNGATATYSKSVGIPDASAWSKSVTASYGHIIGNNILFTGDSVTYGSKSISANFSQGVFATAYSSNDTIKINPITSGVEDPSAVISNDTNSYGITSIQGTPLAYSATPGRLLYIITVLNGVRVYTSTGFTIPAIPTTIGSVTNVVLAGNTVYNGLDGDKKFWAVVSGPAHQFYIAHYSSGGWNDIYGPFVTTENDYANGQRGDTANSWSVNNGTACLTANGRFLHYIEIYVPGGAFFKILEFNISSNTMTTYDWNKFTRTVPTTYSSISPWYGCSFGFSTTFGYYCMIGTEAHTSVLISSSKNVVTGAMHNEDEWFADGSGRYDMNISSEPTVGLSVYLKSYPLFIGGYYAKVPDTIVAVPANATTYIYAELVGGDRQNILITTGADIIANGFSKVLLGSVITNGEKVISSSSSRINNGSITVASLKSIASSSANFTAFKNAILAL